MHVGQLVLDPVPLRSVGVVRRHQPGVPGPHEQPHRLAQHEGVRRPTDERRRRLAQLREQPGVALTPGLVGEQRFGHAELDVLAHPEADRPRRLQVGVDPAEDLPALVAEEPHAVTRALPTLQPRDERRLRARTLRATRIAPTAPGRPPGAGTVESGTHAAQPLRGHRRHGRVDVCPDVLGVVDHPGRQAATLTEPALTASSHRTRPLHTGSTRAQPASQRAASWSSSHRRPTVPADAVSVAPTISVPMAASAPSVSESS